MTVAGEQGQIRVRGLARRFGAHQALQPIDLDLGPGITGLLGPNGSGKSTLMRCLIGLVRPDQGSVTIDGVPLSKDGVEVRRILTFAPGELALYGEARASEMLEFLLRGRDRAARSKARALCEDLGLPLRQKVRGFSHGMKRQLLFAAALAPEVRVRILDEPSEGLDPTKRAQILELLEQDAAAGRTILLSSHHLSEVDRICQRIVFLHQGRLVAEEQSSAVRQRLARHLKVWWEEGVPPNLEVALQGEQSVLLTRAIDHISVTLADQNPLPFLAALKEAGLPAPSGIEHGKVSLAVLYREIYGAEGI